MIGVHLATTTTATVMQSLGPNAHITPVNDVYGVTFRYMRQAGKEDQGLESTFLDLENAGDEIILGAQAIRGKTKVNIFGYFMNVLSD